MITQKHIFFLSFGIAVALGFLYLGNGILTHRSDQVAETVAQNLKEQSSISTSKINEAKSAGVHYHAGIQVYVDDQLVDFARPEYMHFEPCDEAAQSADVNTATDEQNIAHEQEEKAHFHDLVGNVVHVHRPGATWNDLFVNISYEFPVGKSVIGYVNGVEVDDVLNATVESYDSVVIFVGENTQLEEKLQSRVSRETIETIEQTTESCGS